MTDACLELVRTHDKDRFLSALFAPQALQPHILAIHALAAEAARIPHLVSEAQIGEIRLQWWLDTIDGIYHGVAQDHPVAKELAKTVAACGLPKHALHSLVKARQFDLYADRMPGLADLEAYLGETSSSLIQLTCLILDREHAAKASEAAGLGGVAYGLARLLADHKINTKYFPADLSLAVLMIHARSRLAEARTAIDGLPKILLPAFLPVTLTELYLNAALRGQAVPQWRKQWALWRAARREKI